MRKLYLLFPFLLIIGFLVYWNSVSTVSYEEVHLDSIEDQRLKEWLKEKRNKDGTYIFETDNDIFIYYNSSNKLLYSYPDFKLNKSFFQNNLIINVDLNDASSEEYVQNEVLIKTSNKNYDEVKLNEK